jgi:HAD superfamily hydrolase (TIGR01509 family)
VIDAVIFDMDGLLLDSEVYWERARREYCRSRGCDWRPEDELAVKGNNSMEWAARIIERCGFDDDKAVIIEGVTARMIVLYEEHLPLLPGATTVVRDLAALYPLGLASSSPPTLIEHALGEAGLRTYFRVVVSSDEAGRGKPWPDVFLVAAQKLGADPARTVVFEDSSSGIRAAHAAGMRVIAVPNPHYRPDEEALKLATHVLSSLVELRPEMLEDRAAEAPQP